LIGINMVIVIFVRSNETYDVKLSLRFDETP
jgi:hypothetical protein